MYTSKRLTKAYHEAEVMDIDEHSKLILFSDCHRGNGSHSDEFTKNQNTYLHALQHYYDAGFTYIEVGDGNELWEHPKFSVIRAAHSEVFDLIKRFYQDQRFQLIFGNHDIYLKDSNYLRSNLDSYYSPMTELDYALLPGIQAKEAIVLRYTESGQKILVIHGHQGDFTNDQFWVLNMLSLKYFWRYLHAFGFRNPSSPVSNVQKRHKIEKAYVKWIQEQRVALICGHTHRYKMPRQNELPYMNTGSCVFPTSITGIEIDEGRIALIRWQTKVDKRGFYKVVRDVINGPYALERFDIR
jgi:UDP-2,3-diacylglucosamine pyrophosphatase LpxH